MFDFVDYDHFEEQLSGSPLVKIQEESKILKELIITVVVLGLSLNILANSIWSLFDIPSNPIVILYKASVAALAVLTIIILGVYLARLHFKDLSRTQASFRTVLIWDSKTGSVPPLNYASFYEPQNTLNLLADNNDTKETLRNYLKDTNKTNFPEVARQLFERVLLLIITSWRGPTDLKHMTKCFKDFYRYENFLVPESQYDTVALSIPGEYDAYYGVTHLEGGKLLIRWKDGINGTLIISFGTQVRSAVYTTEKTGRKEWHRLSGVALTDSLNPDIDSKGLIRATFNVLIQARLSPFDLSLGRNHSRELFSWIKLLEGNLRKFMDWDYARFRANRTTIGSR